MKFFWKCFILFLALIPVTLLAEEKVVTPATPSPSLPKNTKTLTWEECVRLTLSHNPDLQSFREAILNSDAVRMGAYSTLYPHLTASFSDTRSYRGAGLSSPGNYSTAYNEQLALSQTIFDGFATKGNIDKARSQLNLAFANLNAEKATLSFNLKSSFAQLLFAQQLLKISQDVIEIRETTYRLVRLLYEGGSEDKGAMLLSKANLDQANNQLIQAQRTYELSGLQLSVNIGTELKAPIRVEGELRTEELTTPPDFRQLALQTPIYHQKRAQTDAAAAGITIAESNWYPTITASATFGKTDSQYPPKNYEWTAGFTASYPIFEGGKTYFNVKAATALFRQSLADLSSGTNQAALTLARTYQTLLNDRDNVVIQKELLEATGLRYKVAEARYRNGLMTFEDYNAIIDSYVGQQQSYLSAQRDAVIAEAAWEQSKGMGALP